MQIRKIKSTAGFAAVETLLLVVILGLVAGVGYWVTTQRHKTTASVTSLTPSTATKAASGTATAIDQLTASDAQAETTISTKHDATTQANAASSNAAASNIGGAYNESNY